MGAPSNTTGTDLGNEFVKQVYDTSALHAFRAANVYRAVGDIKRSREEMPTAGNPFTWTKINALSVATSTISETADPSHVVMAADPVTITLNEYGNTTKASKKLKLTSFVDIDVEQAREITANMEESLDTVARDVLVAGTNVRYVGQSARNAITAGNTLTANEVRRARAALAGRNTPYPMNAPGYVGLLHTDVSYDLQAESGQQAWSAPQIYREGATGIWTGELGMLGGVILLETPRAPVLTNAGAGSTVEVYQSVFVGHQALGEAVGEAQHVVISGPYDDLQRFVSVGWYGLLGFGRIREESIQRVESSSSLATNT